MVVSEYCQPGQYDEAAPGSSCDSVRLQTCHPLSPYHNLTLYPSLQSHAARRTPYPELLHRICALSITADIPAIRLVSRTFSEVGAEHLLPEVQLFFVRKSLTGSGPLHAVLGLPEMLRLCFSRQTGSGHSTLSNNWRLQGRISTLERDNAFGILLL